MNRPSDHLTATEAAEAKGVHIKSIYLAVRDGRLKAKQAEKGRAIIIRRKDLDDWKPRRNKKKEDADER